MSRSVIVPVEPTEIVPEAELLNDTMVGRSSQEEKVLEPTLVYVITPSAVEYDSVTDVVRERSFSKASVLSDASGTTCVMLAVATVVDTARLEVTFRPPKKAVIPLIPGLAPRRRRPETATADFCEVRLLLEVTVTPDVSASETKAVTFAVACWYAPAMHSSAYSVVTARPALLDG